MHVENMSDIGLHFSTCFSFLFFSNLRIWVYFYQ